MATYILFWNPAFSSYTMERFLNDFDLQVRVDNWSFYEHEKVEPGDKFYMVRCGEGKTGVVMRGFIWSRSYVDEDWSPKKRKPIYYADIWWTVMINPETAEKRLTPDLLTEAIPDFNWYGGHSGRRLTVKQANALDKLWVNYLNENPGLFPYQALKDGLEIEKMFNQYPIRQMLTKKYGRKCECCGYDYRALFGPEETKDRYVPFQPMWGTGLPRLFYAICDNCNRMPRHVLAAKLSADSKP